jgi:hypothetical protein
MFINQKERGRCWDPIISFNDTPSMTYRPPTMPCLLNVPPTPNSFTLGTKTVTCGALGDIQNANCCILTWLPKTHVHLTVQNTFIPSPRVPKDLTDPASLKSPSKKFSLRLKANSAVSLYNNQKESYTLPNR